jgi:hypothetical protein
MQPFDQGLVPAVRAIRAQPAANDAAGPAEGWRTVPGVEPGWDPYEVWRRRVRDPRSEKLPETEL